MSTTSCDSEDDASSAPPLSPTEVASLPPVRARVAALEAATAGARMPRVGSFSGRMRHRDLFSPAEVEPR